MQCRLIYSGGGGEVMKATGPCQRLANFLQDLPGEDATEHHWDSSLRVVTAILDDSTDEADA